MTTPTTMARADEKILADLWDLLRQATEERSHFYVAGVVRRAIAEITRLSVCGCGRPLSTGLCGRCDNDD